MLWKWRSQSVLNVCRVINYCYLFNTYFCRHLDDAATKKITYRFKFLVNSLLLRLLLSYLREVLFFCARTQHRSEHIEQRITTLLVFLSGDYSGNPPYAHFGCITWPIYKHDVVAQGNHNINHIYHMHMSLT